MGQAWNSDQTLSMLYFLMVSGTAYRVGSKERSDLNEDNSLMLGSQEGICTGSHLFTHQTMPCQSLALPMAQALLARMLSALQHHCHHTHTPALSPVS